MINRIGTAVSLLFILLAIAFASGVFLYKKQITNTVVLIIPDLANDLINHANFAAEKRIAFLRNFGFPGLTLKNNEDLNTSPKTTSCWTQSEFPIVVDGLQIGLVTDCSSGATIFSFAFRSPFLSSAFLGIFLIVLLAYFLPLINYKMKIRDFIQKSKEGGEIKFLQTDKNDQVIGDILNIIQNLSSTKFELERVNLQKEQQQALGMLAKQVAHDIRSPLSALSMVSGALKDIPEDKRLLIRNAVQRINDIANDLLAKSRSTVIGGESISSKEQFRSFQGESEILLLPALVDSLVSEKRSQFRDHINVRIEADFKDSFGAFVAAESKELMRLLSNLINNSVEAFKDQTGDVIVSVRSYQEIVQIGICDSGCGIPSDVLQKLGEAGVSYGKEGVESGSGLGVYHAKKYIEGIGGNFNISSQVGVGTIIDIKLPKVPAPSWFLSSIQLHSGMTIVALDDDLTIHQIWKSRLQSRQIVQQTIILQSFTSAYEFKNFMHTQVFDSKILYLVDYELLGQSTNGLEVIEQLGLQADVVLVTSRYDEPEIKRKCELLKIKLLPKSLAGFVPMEFQNPPLFA